MNFLRSLSLNGEEAAQLYQDNAAAVGFTL